MFMISRGSGHGFLPDAARQRAFQKELSELHRNPRGVRRSCPVSVKLKIKLPRATSGCASRTRFQKISNASAFSRTRLGVTGMYFGVAVEPLVIKNRRTGSHVNTSG